MSISATSAARQQKTLEEILKAPGNSTCADCGALLPRWASVSLGIFVCERCAGIHRKLGTHISKVKSVSFDTWSREHVTQMKNIGNVRSNAVYNPNNERPVNSFDPNDNGRAMEAFLRRKYERKDFMRPPMAVEDGDLLL